MTTDTKIFQQSIASSDYTTAAALGILPGVSVETKFGHSPNSGAVETDVWERGDLQPEYIFPDEAGEAVTLVSDDIADGQLQTIEGIDGATGFERIEKVALDGTTPVAVPGTWRAINRTFNSAGTRFAGTVTTQGDGSISTNIFSVARTGAQQTSQAIYMVPVDKVAVLKSINAGVNKLVGVTVACFFNLKVAKPGGVFLVQVRFGLQRDGSSVVAANLSVPGVYAPLSRAKVSVIPGSSPTDVSAQFPLHLIDKNLVPPAFLAKLEEL